MRLFPIASARSSLKASVEGWRVDVRSVPNPEVHQLPMGAWSMVKTRQMGED
jgi:hypothetical protein